MFKRLEVPRLDEWFWLAMFVFFLFVVFETTFGETTLKEQLLLSDDQEEVRQGF